MNCAFSACDIKFSVILFFRMGTIYANQSIFSFKTNWDLLCGMCSVRIQGVRYINANNIALIYI